MCARRYILPRATPYSFLHTDPQRMTRAVHVHRFPISIPISNSHPIRLPFPILKTNHSWRKLVSTYFLVQLYLCLDWYGYRGSDAYKVLITADLFLAHFHMPARKSVCRIRCIGQAPISRRSVRGNPGSVNPTNRSPAATKISKPAAREALPLVNASEMAGLRTALLSILSNELRGVTY